MRTEKEIREALDTSYDIMHYYSVFDEESDRASLAIKILEWVLNEDRGDNGKT